MNMTLPFRIEQKRLELAAKAAGITYIMYSPPSFPHPSGLLYRREPGARLSVWNPLQDDGDLLRLAVAVPHVDLHMIIVEACQVGGADVGRRVREAFVDAVTGPVREEDPPQRPAPAQAEAQAHDVPAADVQQAQPTSEETAAPLVVAPSA
jgi:hypothetical protein